MKKPKFKIGDTVICIRTDIYSNEPGSGWRPGYTFKIIEIRQSFTSDRIIYFPKQGHGIYEEWLMPIGEDGI